MQEKINKQETLEEVKDLAYYKTNAEEDYLQVPISVLRYISQLEQEQDKNKFSEEDIAEKLFNHPVMDRIRSSKSDAEARRIILQQLKKK
jgi:hypothetical protein